MGDFFLSPDEIAKEIGILATKRYEQFSKYVKEKSQNGQNEELLQELLLFIKKIAHIDFRNYRRNIIFNRTSKRMDATDCHSLEAYIDYLKTHPLEMETLTRYLLFRRSSFFQDAELFDTLRKRVFPKITSGSNQEVRFWVPGCSTGEGVYSLAISVTAFIHAKPRSSPVDIQIFGTDVGESAIQTARTGIYPNSIASEVPPDLLKSFFVKTNNGYRISNSIRDLCVFAKHDLAKDIPFRRIDLIDCRDLLASFDSVFRKRMLPVFHSALNPSGFIVVDNSDGFMSAFSDFFFPVDNKNKVFARETAVLRQEVDLNRDSSSTNFPAPQIELGKSAVDKEVLKASDDMLLSKYAPPSVIVNENFDILQFRGRISPYIEPVSGEASLNLTKMAHPGLLIEILALLHQAKKNRTPVTKEVRSGSHGGNGGDSKPPLYIEVIPISTTQYSDGITHFTIVFRELPEKMIDSDKSMKKGGEKRSKAPGAKDDSPVNDYLQSIIEQLELANQELRATNQELAARLQEYEVANLERKSEHFASGEKDLRYAEKDIYRR